MNDFFYQLELFLRLNKAALFSLMTAFIVTLLCMPPLIRFIKRHRAYDLPSDRKEHRIPIPTFGGVAVVAGLLTSILLWLPLAEFPKQVLFILSVLILLCLGIYDDLRDLPARYKFAIQIGLSAAIAFSGVRIVSAGGIFGIGELPVPLQYISTIITITGITNAFNLIDGIDGLAGGMGFMSLLTLGIFLARCGDGPGSVIAFSLAGALLGFLYFNLNPARIFMGDTGSLVLGFVIAVLCIRFMMLNAVAFFPPVPHGAMFALTIVWLPVFDTLRVFLQRIRNGRSPFLADKTHIHHLLTNKGYSHEVATWTICSIHGTFLLLGYLFRALSAEMQLAILSAYAVLITTLLRSIRAKTPRTEA
ncbi:MAG: hypothetical protein RJA57_340 [Bacteroidota bacterium]|jgi:UDP-N-acetylmuramyl pentapeptide phosphotransferase/UDP-N-acetylglucosamine-1-phosphate transferase